LTADQSLGATAVKRETSITATKLEDAGTGEKVAAFRRNLGGRRPIRASAEPPLEDGKKCSLNV
jgi:hypothetical protein